MVFLKVELLHSASEQPPWDEQWAPEGTTASNRPSTDSLNCESSSIVGKRESPGCDRQLGVGARYGDCKKDVKRVNATWICKKVNKLPTGILVELDFSRDKGIRIHGKCIFIWRWVFPGLLDYRIRNIHMEKTDAGLGGRLRKVSLFGSGIRNAPGAFMRRAGKRLAELIYNGSKLSLP